MGPCPGAGLPAPSGQVGSRNGSISEPWTLEYGASPASGPAGGTLVAGTVGPDITIDAVEFCRVVSGRSGHDHGLMVQQLPF